MRLQFVLDGRPRYFDGYEEFFDDIVKIVNGVVEINESNPKQAELIYPLKLRGYVPIDETTQDSPIVEVAPESTPVAPVAPPRTNRGAKASH